MSGSVTTLLMRGDMASSYQANAKVSGLGAQIARQAGDERISRPALIGFSMGSLGTGIYSITPSVLLLYFMTDIIGIAAGLAALAVALPKLWDVFTDPLMGVISDRTRTRWGRRRPYLLIGAIMMSISFIFLFSVPEWLSLTGQFWYVFIVFTASATAYTIFAVPYITMPAEMSHDPHERTVIMSYRMGFAFVGMLIGATAAPMLVDWFGGGRNGYAAMSYVIGGFCAAMMLVTFFATRKLPSTVYRSTALPYKEQLRSGLKNRPFFILLAAYFIQLAGIATFLAAAPFFVVYIIKGSASSTGMIFLFMLSAGLCSMPLWVAASARFGKLASYSFAVIAYSATSFGFTLIDMNTAQPLFYILVTTLGLAFGCLMMMPFSMLSDTVHYDGVVSGLQREGVFTGLWTAGEKSGLAVGPMIAGLILSLSGFTEAAGGVQHVQSEQALWGIQLAFCVVPPSMVLASLIILKFYKLTPDMISAAAREQKQS